MIIHYLSFRKNIQVRINIQFGCVKRKNHLSFSNLLAFLFEIIILLMRYK